MSLITPNLQLPLIAPSQAMKHVTHNEAIARLDAITQMSVVEFDATVPPAVPEEDECYGLGGCPVADRSGRAEIGLVGDDALAFKVSADGSTFNDAFKMRATDGLVETPSLRSGQIAIDDDSVGTLYTPGAGGIIALSLVDSDYPQA